MLVAALLLEAVPAAGLSAEDAMDRYRREIGAKVIGGAESGPRCGAGGTSDEVVICGKRDATRDRLPLQDERFTAGEAVHHASEPASAAAGLGGPPGEPSRLMQTVGKLFRTARGAITGEDPGY